MSERAPRGRRLRGWLRPRRLAPAAVALLTVVTLGACGLSESGPPTKIGDKVNVPGGPSSDDRPIEPEGPTETTDPTTLVQNFLEAAAGGDNAASARLTSYMTPKGQASWMVPVPEQGQTVPLTVIRLQGPPVDRLAVGNRTPVDIRFQIVGTLNDDGLVTDVSGDASKVHDLTFYVVPLEDRTVRIDQIDGIDGLKGPWLSDEALTTMYRPQTIYFWDSANSRLIPDLRYLPLTLGREQRASKIVQWLLDAPSPWLGQFAQRLPSGATIKEGVTNQNGTWKINLSAASGAGGPDAVKRLYYQLQMSLRTDRTPSIELFIESQRQPSPGPELYLHFNLFFGLDSVRPDSFDVVDGKVITQRGIDPPAVLKSPENQNVLYAAVDRTGATMALVRTGQDNKRSLTLVPDGNGTKVDTQVPRRGDLGRPIFVPGSDLVLIPAGNELLLVQHDGSVSTVILPRPASALTSVSVAPDGRRIAWVGGGEAFVAPLMVSGSTVSVGSSARAVLPPNQLNARAIAWTGEAWLYVVGTARNTGAPVVLRTTVDSAVATQLTGGLLGSAAPTDVVALANSAPTNPGQVVVFTAQALFNFASTIGTGNSLVKNPFYVS